MKIIIIAFVILLVCYLFYRFINWKLSLIFTSTKKNLSITPEDYKIPYETVYFNSYDGVELKGWFIESKKESDKVLIIPSGYDKTSSDLLKETIYLNDFINLFYFDFRACGGSKGKMTTLGIYERYDIAGAVKFLKEFRADYSTKIFAYLTSFASITLSEFANVRGVDGAILFEPVVDYLKMIKKIASQFSLYILPLSLIRKKLHIDSLDINDKIRSFNIPVVIIAKAGDLSAYNLIKADRKAVIEYKDKEDFSSILPEALKRLYNL